MTLRYRSLPLITAFLLLSLASCGKKESSDNAPAAAPAATFTVYQGARYLPEITDTFKRAATAIDPAAPPPPQVLYDTEAPLEQVAEFYTKNNGHAKVWPDSTGDFSTVQPPAFYRTGDLATDFSAIEPVLKKLNMQVDAAKSVGAYRGAHISGNGHPRVTLSRPYFDFVKQEVVDRTLIIMVRE